MLVIGALQIFDLRHMQRAIETLDDPARKPDMIRMGVGHDQPRDLHGLQRPFEQFGPGRDGGFVAETGIDHGPAVAIGEQVDVHMVQAKRQLQADPEHARANLDHLVQPGRGLERIAQGIGRLVCCLGGGWGVCMHRDHNLCLRLKRTLAVTLAEIVPSGVQTTV